jgi:hypothetical protein
MLYTYGEHVTMPKMTPGPDIHIAALEQKKVVDHSNLMKPGSGTPWEDRGHIGAVKAFFATCGAGMFSPVRLMHSIRRPETSSDVRSFVITCGAIWGVSAFEHAVLLLWRRGEEWWPHENYWYWVGAAGLGALAPVMVWLMHLLATAILNKINSIELGSRAPGVLTYNIAGYALAPSLAALVPVAGPIAAILWIVGVAIAAANSRLRLKVGTSIINVLLTSLAVLGAFAVTMLVLRILFAALIRYFEES